MNHSIVGPPPDNKKRRVSALRFPFAQCVLARTSNYQTANVGLMCLVRKRYDLLTHEMLSVVPRAARNELGAQHGEE